MKVTLLLFCLNFFLISDTGYSQNVLVGDSSYATLKEAFDGINAGAHTGSVEVIIRASTVETATAELYESGYGSASYTSVTIRPDSFAVTVTGSITGALVKLSATDSVVIDGRIDGSGRNLTFINSVTTSFHNSVIWISDRNTSTFPHVTTGAHNNVIRNCNIAGAVDQSVTVFGIYGIVLSGLSTAAGLSTFEGTDNDNNFLTDNHIYKTMHGILAAGSSSNLNDSNRFTNNLIGSDAFNSDRVSCQGISIQHQNACLIEGNEIRFLGNLSTEPLTGGATRCGISIGTFTWVTVSKTLGTNCKVNGNYIHDIIDENNSYSALGIGVATFAVSASTKNLISNNVIYNVKSLFGFNSAIVHAGGYGDMIVHNSIYLYGSLYTSSESGTGIRVTEMSDSALIIKNNAIFMDFTYTGTSSILKSHCIVLPGMAYSWGTGGCNYNAYYFLPSNTKMHVGGTGTSPLYTAYTTLPMWRFVFTPMQDLTSFYGNPEFYSTTYLFPKPTSPLLGAGTPIAEVTKDILGSSRSPFSPSIGAYENDSVALPVELTSFTSVVNDNSVTLNWSTSSELNNAGFYVERSSGNYSTGDWISAGFVNGNGTVNGISGYTFTENSLSTGKYRYRLKQTDFNGNFEYFYLMNEAVIGIPEKFDLSQNYPNPFNPVTKINFEIPAAHQVSLKVFDLSGREIAELINERLEAGYHSVNFNAGNFSSGVYFYELTAGKNRSVKKMMIIK